MSEISNKLEDYIEAIYLLEKEHTVARIKDISLFLDVKPPTVLSAVSRLVNKKLAVHEHYGYIELTRKGKRIARQVYQRHKILLQFLEEIFGIPSDKALPQACDMEHIITSRTKELFEKLNDFFKNNPEIFQRWLDER